MSKREHAEFYDSKRDVCAPKGDDVHQNPGRRSKIEARMSLHNALLLMVSIALSATAQLVLKLGAGALRTAGGDAIGPTLVSIASSPLLIGGLAMYGVSALVWIKVLSQLELSAAYPFVGLSFIFVLIASAAFLHEHITMERALGTALITIGCALVARSA
ncbi:MAG TPA: EamA family transporter [Rhizomicrobium sp.]|nr:EamA family transporter [Rhizomicrobium sp.]